MKKKVVQKKDLKQKTRKRKRKSHKVRNIFIALLIFLVIMGAILLVALSHEDSNNDGALIDEVLQGEQKELDLDDKTVKKLFNLYSETSVFKINYAEGLNNNVEPRLYYTYLSLSEDDLEEVRCSDVGLVILYDEDNYFKALCSLNTTYPEEIDVMESEIRSNNTTGIEASSFEEKYKALFGNVAYDKIDFEYMPGQIMHYDSRTDSFVKYYSETGGTGIDIDALFKSAVSRNKKLEMTITYNITAMDGDIESYDVVYKFEKSKETNDYIFMSRTKKETK